MIDIKQYLDWLNMRSNDIRKKAANAIDKNYLYGIYRSYQYAAEAYFLQKGKPEDLINQFSKEISNIDKMILQEAREDNKRRMQGCVDGFNEIIKYLSE